MVGAEEREIRERLGTLDGGCTDMTAPRGWPTNAEWARLDVIGKADEGLGKLAVLIERDNVSQVEMMRCVNAAMVCLYGIKEILILAKNGELKEVG
uniref:Uncharacterized protein n=1 Tax=viral metagenome TaxID=1070528 RepID=A0A6M3KTZ8_9ZZZZ